MAGTDWDAVWTAVTDDVAAHLAAGRGHLLTGTDVRLATAVAVTTVGGLDPSRLRVEAPLPALAGDVVDLAVDAPTGTLLQFSVPGAGGAGATAGTTAGAALRDVLVVARGSSVAGWVVQLVTPDLAASVADLYRRHRLEWATAPGERSVLPPSALPGLLASTAGGEVPAEPVTGTCVHAVDVGDGLTLYVHRVDPVSPAAAAAVLKARGGPPPGERTAGPGDREEARREILDVVRSLAERTGRDAVSVPDVVAEMRRRGTDFADSTIRTMVTIHLVRPATGGAADLERVGPAHYRLAAGPLTAGVTPRT